MTLMALLRSWMTWGTEVTEEQLRALNDPWINWFLSEQERLIKEMKTDNLVHMAQSFGSPRTEGAARYKAHGNELERINSDFKLYALYKGYIKLEELDFSYYERTRPPR